jgi:acyl dehydratase
VPILPQQALLYRLCGDRNPLHSDPEFAAAAGFPKPILHGLCTYGMTCKAIIDSLLDGDAGAVAAYGARFADAAFPDETLKVGIWKDDGRFLASGAQRRRAGPGLASEALEDGLGRCHGLPLTLFVSDTLHAERPVRFEEACQRICRGGDGLG